MTDSLDYWWLLPIFGFFIGILASLTGVGGGVFIVPILTLFFGFVVQAATGTSLTAIIFTAIASTINYAKQKRVYFRTGATLVVTTAPGAYIGASIADIMDERLLGVIFGVFLILVAARTVMTELRKKAEINKQQVKTDLELFHSGRIIVIGIGLSFFGGIASGLLGIGGGTLIVPIMAFALGMPIHYATATSMFTMIFTSISAVTKYYQSNRVDFSVALLFAAGSILGAQVGAYTSKKLSSRNLTLAFAIILVVAGINMLIKYGPA
jgi:uncharacterized membrane protein YfcA